MPLGEFAVARVLTALCLALSQAVVLLAVGHFAFGVQIAGNLLSVIPLVIVGALCFIAIGSWSARSRRPRTRPPRWPTS